MSHLMTASCSCCAAGQSTHQSTIALLCSSRSTVRVRRVTRVRVLVVRALLRKLTAGGRLLVLLIFVVVALLGWVVSVRAALLIGLLIILVVDLSMDESGVRWRSVIVLTVSSLIGLTLRSALPLISPRMLTKILSIGLALRLAILGWLALTPTLRTAVRMVRHTFC